MNIAIENNNFTIDAGLVAHLLDIAPDAVQPLMRDGHITTRCETGIDDHRGQYRLNFFYGKRSARVSINASGRVISRSAIVFKDGAPNAQKSQQPLQEPSK